MKLLLTVLALFAGSAFCNIVDTSRFANITCLNSKYVVEERPELTYVRIVADSGETLFDVNSGITRLDDFGPLLTQLNERLYPEEGQFRFGNSSDYYIINNLSGSENELTIVSRPGANVFRKSLPLRPELANNPTRCAHIYGYNLITDPKFDINRPDGYGITPLMWSSYFGLSSLAKSLVLERGADVNKESILGITPIVAAIGANQVELVDFLIQKGVNINNEIGHSKMTPLHIAAYKGRLEIARSLIEHGADVNAANNREKLTPLHMASGQGHCNVVGLLISKGANVNALTFHDKTPLHFATRGWYTECGHKLLAAGADINARDYEGETALTMAVRTRPDEEAALQIVDHLLKEHNADSSIRTNKGDTAQSIAENRGFTKVVELLKSRTTA